MQKEAIKSPCDEVAGQIFIVDAANNHSHYLLDLELVVCAYEFRILLRKDCNEVVIERYAKPMTLCCRSP